MASVSARRGLAPDNAVGFLASRGDTSRLNRRLRQARLCVQNRSTLLAEMELQRHDQLEGLPGELGWRRGQGLRALDQRQGFLVQQFVPRSALEREAQHLSGPVQ